MTSLPKLPLAGRSPVRVAAGLAAAGALLALLAFRAAAQIVVPTNFQDQLLVNGLDWPAGIAFLPDGRLVVVELKSAKVRMIVQGGLASVDPIATVDSVQAMFEEQGLFAVAVDPRWPVKPFMYVMYTAQNSTIRVSRLTFTGDLSNGSSGNLSFVPGSRRDLINDIPDLLENHNGGCLRFAADQMLYVSFAEDARACMATDTTVLFGVLARMDVRNLPDGPGPPNKSLLVPPDNPYVDRPDVDTKLMYARGLRNPFRIHVDAPTGRVFIADVGWETWEEMDVVDAPGMYFGWPFYEGTAPFVTTECGVGPPATPITWPAFEYTRGQFCPLPDPSNCASAIIGGVVFRHVDNSNVSFPADYDGQYMFSDYYDGFIWRIRDSSSVWVKAPAAPGQPNSRDWARGYRQVSDYILGPDGAVYYAKNAYSFESGTGEVRRIIYTSPQSDVSGGPAAGVSFTSVYPSPAHGSATLSYSLTRPARVRLTLYDAAGRRVRELVPESVREAGEHRAFWDGRDASGRSAPPGVYVARLSVEGAVLTRRVPLVR